MRFPTNVFEWRQAFNDDLGYHPLAVPEPTTAKPGSPEKVAILVERALRGQELWVEEDAKGEKHNSVTVDPPCTFDTVGNEDFGAGIGVDFEGRKHRYAIWKRINPEAKLRVAYVVARSSFVDHFGYDKELWSIANHAAKLGAGFITVVPLLSIRVARPADIKEAMYPVTEVGLLWIRWMVRNCHKTIACWGETRTLDRFRDVGWMLDRTVRKKLFSVSEGQFWPEEINESTSGELYKYDYRELLVKSGEALEDELSEMELDEPEEAAEVLR
jgi:hypothetical protein